MNLPEPALLPTELAKLLTAMQMLSLPSSELPAPRHSEGASGGCRVPRRQRLFLRTCERSCLTDGARLVSRIIAAILAMSSELGAARAVNIHKGRVLWSNGRRSFASCQIHQAPNQTHLLRHHHHHRSSQTIARRHDGRFAALPPGRRCHRCYCPHLLPLRLLSANPCLSRNILSLRRCWQGPVCQGNMHARQTAAAPLRRESNLEGAIGKGWKTKNERSGAHHRSGACLQGARHGRPRRVLVH